MVFIFVDSSCYSLSNSSYSYGTEIQEVLMGYTAACAGESTIIKDPSAVIVFDKSSVLSECVFINISIVYQVSI